MAGRVVMKFPVQTSPHVEARSNVADVMTVVLWALVPGTVVAIWLLGWGVLFNVALAVGAAWLAEALMLWLRARPFQPALSDRSRSEEHTSELQSLRRISYAV